MLTLGNSIVGNYGTTDTANLGRLRGLGDCPSCELGLNFDAKKCDKCLKAKAKAEATSVVTAAVDSVLPSSRPRPRPAAEPNPCPSCSPSTVVRTSNPQDPRFPILLKTYAETPKTWPIAKATTEEIRAYRLATGPDRPDKIIKIITPQGPVFMRWDTAHDGGYAQGVGEEGNWDYVGSYWSVFLIALRANPDLIKPSYKPPIAPTGSAGGGTSSGGGGSLVKTPATLSAGLPGWVLPVGAGVVLLAGVAFFLKRRGGHKSAVAAVQGLFGLRTRRRRR